MKFFPEIGSRCLTTVVEEAATAVNKPGIAQLSCPETAAGDQRKHHHKYFTGGGPLDAAAAAHWRPSLSVISENGVVPFRAGGDQSERKKNVKNDDKRNSMAKKGDYSHRNDSIEMPIPVYSPTPFTF